VEVGKHIQYSVVATQGDYDPHLFEGAEKPLSQIFKDFGFILLKNCRHKPWIERIASEWFYEILRVEVRKDRGYVGL
jgi:hypothetical protein